MSDLQEIAQRIFVWWTVWLGINFGDDEDDLNKALLQATDEVWVKNHSSCNSSILGFGFILGSIYNKHCLPPTKPN